MYLFFPQWQGSGATDEVYRGAQRVRESLPAILDFVDVPVKPLHPITLENNIWGYAVLTEQLESASNILKQQNPAHIFSVGGDCAGELAPVSFLNQRYQGDLAVAWFDAHADMNTPDSSPSGMFHGMPLRTLLGEGDSHMVATMFSTLKPNQVFLVGAREFDPDEERYIQAHQVSVFSPDTLAQNPQHVVDAIANGGFNNVYIHLDFDVLDPAQFPFTDFPAANGVDMPELITVLDMLRDHFNVVGFSLLELVAGENPSLAPLQPLFDWYTSLAQQ